MAQKGIRVIGWMMAIVAIAAPADAQDEPRFALVASLPTPTVAVQWEVSERFAVRVDGSYNYRNESTDRVTSGGSFTDRSSGIIIVNETVMHTESATHTGSIGVAGIVTIHRSDQLRLYVAPRLSLSFAKQHVTATTTTRTTPPPTGTTQVIFGPSRDGTDTFENSSTSPTAGGSFGAAANVHRRLAVFGEVGFSVGWSDTSLPGVFSGVSPLSQGASTRTTVNTRAVTGVMIRF
jgi:hypothetical protein